MSHAHVIRIDGDEARAKYTELKKIEAQYQMLRDSAYERQSELNELAFLLDTGERFPPDWE